ncbi:MAG TPA: FAD-dependent oxidoreductase [Bryobacteraceae bacterium]|nr:FAD-dependent oxidoreductase [Bryobacteraceae bacterium]
MGRVKFTIVGGGMVAGYAAKQFVELGAKPGDLAILSGDAAIPYERPPLSKGFLLGLEDEASIRINPEDFYRQNGIEIRLKCTVRSVDTNKRRLVFQSGEELLFDNLVLATGSRARRLDIPGANLPNVLYLRSMSDSKRIRQTASGAKRAVVLGGGFIGMEVASALTQLDVETTIAMREERVCKNFFTPEMSRFFENYYANRGVRFVHGVKLVELQGSDCLTTAVFADGKTIACDLLVAGIGAQPSLDFLEGSGIKIDNGVVVDEHLETSTPGIFAAGDIANYPDVLFAKRRRVEHWDNAVSQGRHVARTLISGRTQFRHVPYVFSDVFDLSYELWGDPTGADRVVYRGDPATKNFSAWWTRANIVVSAFLMNRPDKEREWAPRMIESKRVVQVANLIDETAALAD